MLECESGYILQNSTLYREIKEIVEKIIELYKSKTKQDDLIRLGSMRLKYFRTAKDRAGDYLQILEKISKNNMNKS